MEPCPKTTVLKSWLKTNAPEFIQILGESFRNQKSMVIDLSQSSEMTLDLEGKDVWEQQEYIENFLDKNDALFGIGKYGECRSCYSTDSFLQQVSGSSEMRTIHLGVDLFVPNKTPIHAPLDGVVVISQDNAGDLDYGPTIILEHHPEPGPEFYTLFGHLSLSLIHI